MATSASKIEYASRATYGNIAYDLNRVRNGEATYDVPFDMPENNPNAHPDTVQQPDSVRRQQKAQRVKTHAHAKAGASTMASAKQGISLFSIFGFAALAVLLVFMLLANVELTKVSDETVQLQDTLEDLESEQAKLTVKYESTFNLNEIEEYAMNVLGMTKLTDENAQTLSVTTEDKAVIIDDSSKDGLGIFGTLTTVLTSLAEYFR